MELHSGDPEASSSRRVQSKVAVFVSVLLVAAHGLAEPGQELGQRIDVLIGEDEDGRLICPDSPEFHRGLVVASGIKSHGDVLGPVLVDEEDAS